MAIAFEEDDVKMVLIVDIERLLSMTIANTKWEKRAFQD